MDLVRDFLRLPSIASRQECNGLARQAKKVETFFHRPKLFALGARTVDGDFERLVTLSIWCWFDSSRRGGQGDVVSRFALYDLVLCAAVAARFSHSSLGALRILAHFSASRRLLETASRPRPVDMVFIRRAATCRARIWHFRRMFAHLHFLPFRVLTTWLTRPYVDLIRTATRLTQGYRQGNFGVCLHTCTFCLVVPL